MRTLLLLLAGTALFAPRLADACDCNLTLAQAKDQASVVFLGTITKQHDSKVCSTPNRCERLQTYTVKVAGVYKGKVGKTATVEVRPDGKCAFGELAKHGKRWLFFSSTAEPFHVFACRGSTPATKVRLAEAAKQLGTAVAP